MFSSVYRTLILTCVGIMVIVVAIAFGCSGGGLVNKIAPSVLPATAPSDSAVGVTSVGTQARPRAVESSGQVKPAAITVSGATIRQSSVIAASHSAYRPVTATFPQPTTVGNSLVAFITTADTTQVPPGWTERDPNVAVLTASVGAGGVPAGTTYSFGTDSSVTQVVEVAGAAPAGWLYSSDVVGSTSPLRRTLRVPARGGLMLTAWAGLASTITTLSQSLPAGQSSAPIGELLNSRASGNGESGHLALSVSAITSEPFDAPQPFTASATFGNTGNSELVGNLVWIPPASVVPPPSPTPVPTATASGPVATPSPVITPSSSPTPQSSPTAKPSATPTPRPPPPTPTPISGGVQPAPQLALNPNPFTARACVDPCSGPPIVANSGSWMSAYFPQGLQWEHLQYLSPPAKAGASNGGAEDVVLGASAADPVHACNGCADFGSINLRNGAYSVQSAGDWQINVVNNTSSGSAPNYEMDFWQFSSQANPIGAGQAVSSNASGGCRTNAFAGGGNTCTMGTASYLPFSDFQLDPVELLHGMIPHMLNMLNQCDSGFIAPAKGSDGNCGGGPPQGAVLWLDWTDAQIDASNVPRWAKTLYHSLHQYGWMEADTSGDQLVRLQAVSGPSWTIIGQPDPWISMYAEMRAEGTPVNNQGVFTDVVFPVPSGMSLANFHWTKLTFSGGTWHF